MRGGIGVFHNQLRNNLALQHILSYPFQEQPVFRDTTLENPIKPVTIPLIGQLYVIDPDITTPYSIVYSIGTQWQFVTNTILEVAYVGNRGYDLLQFEEMNQPIYVAGADDGGEQGSLSGRIPDSARCCSVQLGAVRLQRPRDERQRRFTDGLEFQASYALSKSQDNSSAFHSGATSRTYLLKPQDANDQDAEYAASDFDARHRFTVGDLGAAVRRDRAG